MDTLLANDATNGADKDATSSEPMPSLAPPSTSNLSDAPSTASMQPPAPDVTGQGSAVPPVLPDAPFQTAPYSAQTESILKRINENAANAATKGTPEWEAAREQVMREMATSEKFPTPTPPTDTNIPTSTRGGRGGKQNSSGNGSPGRGHIAAVKTEGGDVQPTPVGRGRGRGGGRPRGRGRGGSRGSKRKREGDSGEDTDDSEVYTPLATTTKSGRSIQKPVSFVPPPLSPTTTPNKRKRTYRRNPESAVCRVCLRGTSPASNMIVFCDGCNVPYHRMCHKPPIDQAVIDEVDKEWYCKQCESQRLVPVPEAEVADFVSAEGASAEQRQRYFASLPPGVLVTLLTRATTLHPDLPVFTPHFQARQSADTIAVAAAPVKTNGHAHPSPSAPSRPDAHGVSKPSRVLASATSLSKPTGNSDHGLVNELDAGYGPEEHPPHYPRPGQGLMRTLPPEQEDLQWLVEDDRHGVFSHVYQADLQAAHVSTGGVTEHTQG